jgi:hypothetical protein
LSRPKRLISRVLFTPHRRAAPTKPEDSALGKAISRQDRGASVPAFDGPQADRRMRLLKIEKMHQM